jgi:broad specificity phosphatase PhoE
VTPRIILVRHGPSAHVHPGGVIDRLGVERWRDAYDAAGIQTVGEPPGPVVQMAAEATHIVASDLPRAIRSAERLAPQRPIHLSELLRESSIAIPHWPTRLPLHAWGMLMHLGWMYGVARGSDAYGPDRDRAVAAAELLAGLVADGSTALVVTHGVFRRLIAQQLVGRGWASSGRHGGYRHWSYWSYSA